MKMGPREAADFIRDKIHTTTMDPVLQHQAKYVDEVRQYLGLDHSTNQHVFDVLRENGIEIPSGDEYPKWLGVLNGRDMIADNEEHERKLLAEMNGTENDGLIINEDEPSIDEPDDEDEEDEPAPSKKKAR